MGILKVGIIDLNDSKVVTDLRSVIKQLVQNPSSYYSLRFKPPYYFKVLDGPLPSEKGWYIILDDGKPIYAGQTSDLNKRLNTNQGSPDNFGQISRLSDAKRNFIKKFHEVGILNRLRVCVIRESDLCKRLSVEPANLTNLDRDNIEKVIDIYRSYFNYVA